METILEGNDGNDSLVGDEGQDRIFAGERFVFAFDGDEDCVSCNGESRYKVLFGRGLDELDRRPEADPGERGRVTSVGDASTGPGTAVSVREGARRKAVRPRPKC